MSPTNSKDTENAIEIAGLRTELGGHLIHQDIHLCFKRGEISAIVGGSGSGKTTLLREILLLQPPSAGTIKVFGQDILQSSEDQIAQLRRRLGMLFQQGALFSSLTLLENVLFPLQQHTKLQPTLMREIALLKILLAGLSLEAANKYPSELSGGMQKRAALARAIVLDPSLLLLDEPTAGLDPESANALDELILKLKTALGLTVVMVTHDLDTLWRTVDRIAFLAEGKVIVLDSPTALAQSQIPVVNDYFNGPRGRAARGAASWKPR
jgi:phospholipid/cholesterol/gamma-HCH transport system ATP-binding protein